MSTELKEDWERAVYSVLRLVHINGAEPIQRRMNPGLTFLPDTIEVRFTRTEGGSWEFDGMLANGDPINSGGRVSKLRRMSEVYRSVEDLKSLPTWVVDIVNRAMPREDF